MDKKLFKVAKSIHNTNRTHYFRLSEVTSDVAVAVPTNKSLLIYTLSDSLSMKYDELTFQLDSLACHDEKKDLDVGVDRISVHESLPSDKGENAELVTLMIDSTMSPLAHHSVSFKAYRCAQWSPVGADLVDRPVLATITLDHRLAIYSLQQRKKKFKQVIDLASLFEEALKAEDYAIVNTRLQDCMEKLELYTKLQQRSYALSAVSLIWTRTWDSDNSHKCCLLIVAVKSGHLVLWKVALPVTEGCVDLLEFVDAGNTVPSYMEVANLNQKCVLFVGFNNGVLKSFTVKPSGGDFELMPNTTLWQDEDRILVSTIVWDAKNNVLLFGKGPYLLVMHLDVESDVCEVLERYQRALSPTSNISGICRGKEYCVVSVQDGSMFRVKIDTQKGLEVLVSEMEIDRSVKDVEQWKCHDVKMSPNSVYLIESCSPNQKYDHLSLKMPHHVNLIQLRGSKELYEMLPNLPDTASLCDIKDVLCCIRCCYNQTQPRRFEEPVKSWLLQKQLWPDFPLVRLKLIRYFIMASITEKVKEEEAEEKEKLEMERLFLEELILIQHALSSLRRCVRAWTTLTCTDQDKTSLSLLCKFLQSRHIDDVVVSETLKLLTSEPSLPAVLEQCVICETDIATTQVMGEGCPKGHKIARCCQSLLLCQDLPYRVCSTCRALSRSKPTADNSWLTALLSNHCTFCDGLLV